MLTIGSLQAGDKENVIPDEALIKLNVRTFDEGVRTRVPAAITRIVNAEAAASGASKPPQITALDRYSLVTHDPDATRRVVDAFRKHFGEDRAHEAKPTSAREDFGVFGAAWRVRRWRRCKDVRGGQERGKRPLPTNHNPRFAPVVHPTLETGVAAMIVASPRAWLAA